MLLVADPALVPAGPAKALAGLAHIAEASEKFAHLGKTYELTDGMKAKLAAGETYY